MPSEKIVKYLLNSFEDVESIILHGSRAVDCAHKHSDWDFILLTNKEQKQERYRTTVDDQNIEFSLHILPIVTDTFLEIFGAKLQFAQIIFDKHEHGQILLDMAKKIYAQGLPLSWVSPEEKEFRKMNRQHIVHELEDTVDEPAVFLKKLGKFYPWIINEWYFFKRGTFSKNLYFALPEIQEKDPYFANMLNKIYRLDVSSQEKAKTAQQIIDYIYE